MEVLVYDILLLFMLLLLYKAGKQIYRTDRIFNPIAILAIVGYTLNEGLRFGRGTDYNLYGMTYEYMEKGGDTTWDVMFKFFANTFIGLGFSWQGYIIFMSLVFIIATIVLLKVYKNVLPFAVPFFVLFSISETENMVRWYLGFSFILIGMSFLLGDGNKRKTKFLLFSIFACTFHLALVPIPIIFFLVTFKEKFILKPIPALVIFFLIAFLFQTSFMLQFVELANMLSTVSEHFEGYAYRAEYWLTGGFANTGKRNALPNIVDLTFLCCLTVLGYYIIKQKGEKKGVYAYNLFIIGLLLYPIANQIELLQRYDQPFLFFRAIILAYIVKYAYITKTVIINKSVLYASLLIFVCVGGKILLVPFTRNPEQYLYVWNSKGRSYHSMYSMWISNMYESKKRN